MQYKEHSYGIIPLRRHKGEWEVLLICHQKGHWAFPKGHKEKEETPLEAAERELKEETGLIVTQFLPTPTLEEHYSFKRQDKLIDKTVTYFLAEVSGTILLQAEEISHFQWAKVEKAQDIVTFAEAKKLCERLLNYLKHASEDHA